MTSVIFISGHTRILTATTPDLVKFMVDLFIYLFIGAHYGNTVFDTIIQMQFSDVKMVKIDILSMNFI